MQIPAPKPLQNLRRNVFTSPEAVPVDLIRRAQSRQEYRMAWWRLVLWRDANQDRVSQPGELRGLDAEGLTEIDLGYRSVVRCEAGGSCEGERASVRWRDASGRELRGAVIDVRLASR